MSLIITDQQIPAVHHEEDDDDVEYNVLADLHSDEDYEELRHDRAVHISREPRPPSVCLYIAAVFPVLCRERS